MLHGLARALFRLWLAMLAGPLWVWSCALEALATIFGARGGDFRERVADRLLAPGSVVFPALLALGRDTPEFPFDGPGFSEADVPRLWATCRDLAGALGCPPPDAVHLTLEAGGCMAWTSKTGGGPARRHICLSLLDLRLVTADEARAVIAHELAHVGFDHGPRRAAREQVSLLMGEVGASLPFPLSLPVRLAQVAAALGERLGAHDDEREADRKAAEVVGGNHAAWALRRILVQAPVLERVSRLVRARAEAGGRAPERLAEAAARLYKSHDFRKLLRLSRAHAERADPEHPGLSDRVAASERAPPRPDADGRAGFVEAYPELLACEERLTRTYFPDAPVHARSDASTLKRRALAARLKAR